MRPMICQKLLAGLAKEKSSTIILFQSIFPTKARRKKAKRKARSAEILAA